MHEVADLREESVDTGNAIMDLETAQDVFVNNVVHEPEAAIETGLVQELMDGVHRLLQTLRQHDSNKRKYHEASRLYVLLQILDQFGGTSRMAPAPSAFPGALLSDMFLPPHAVEKLREGKYGETGVSQLLSLLVTVAQEDDNSRQQQQGRRRIKRHKGQQQQAESRSSSWGVSWIALVTHLVCSATVTAAALEQQQLGDSAETVASIEWTDVKTSVRQLLLGQGKAVSPDLSSTQVVAGLALAALDIADSAEGAPPTVTVIAEDGSNVIVSLRGLTPLRIASMLQIPSVVDYHLLNATAAFHINVGRLPLLAHFAQIVLDYSYAPKLAVDDENDQYDVVDTGRICDKLLRSAFSHDSSFLIRRLSVQQLQAAAAQKASTSTTITTASADSTKKRKRLVSNDMDDDKDDYNSKPCSRVALVLKPSYPFMVRIRVDLATNKRNDARNVASSMEVCTALSPDEKASAWSLVLDHLRYTGDLFLDGSEKEQQDASGFDSVSAYQKRRSMLLQLRRFMGTIGFDTMIDFYKQLVENTSNDEHITPEETRYITKACQDTILRLCIDKMGQIEGIERMLCEFPSLYVWGDGGDVKKWAVRFLTRANPIPESLLQDGQLDMNSLCNRGPPAGAPIEEQEAMAAVENRGIRVEEEGLEVEDEAKDEVVVAKDYVEEIIESSEEEVQVEESYSSSEEEQHAAEVYDSRGAGDAVAAQDSGNREVLEILSSSEQEEEEHVAEQQDADSEGSEASERRYRGAPGRADDDETADEDDVAAIFQSMRRREDDTARLGSVREAIHDEEDEDKHEGFAGSDYDSYDDEDEGEEASIEREGDEDEGVDDEEEQEVIDVESSEDDEELPDTEQFERDVSSEEDIVDDESDETTSELEVAREGLSEQLDEQHKDASALEDSRLGVVREESEQAVTETDRDYKQQSISQVSDLMPGSAEAEQQGQPGDVDQGLESPVAHDDGPEARRGHDRYATHETGRAEKALEEEAQSHADKNEVSLKGSETPVEPDDYSGQVDRGYEPDTTGQTEEDVSEAHPTEDEYEDDKKKASGSSKQESPRVRLHVASRYTFSDMDAADERTEAIEEDESSEIEGRTRRHASASSRRGVESEVSSALAAFAQSAQRATPGKSEADDKGSDRTSPFRRPAPWPQVQAQRLEDQGVDEVSKERDAHDAGTRETHIVDQVPKIDDVHAGEDATNDTVGPSEALSDARTEETAQFECQQQEEEEQVVDHIPPVENARDADDTSAAFAASETGQYLSEAYTANAQQPDESVDAKDSGEVPSEGRGLGEKKKSARSSTRNITDVPEGYMGDIEEKPSSTSNAPATTAAISMQPPGYEADVEEKVVLRDEESLVRKSPTAARAIPIELSAVAPNADHPASDLFAKPAPSSLFGERLAAEISGGQMATSADAVNLGDTKVSSEGIPTAQGGEHESERSTNAPMGTADDEEGTASAHGVDSPALSNHLHGSEASTAVDVVGARPSTPPKSASRRSNPLLGSPASHTRSHDLGSPAKHTRSHDAQIPFSTAVAVVGARPSTPPKSASRRSIPFLAGSPASHTRSHDLGSPAKHTRSHDAQIPSESSTARKRRARSHDSYSSAGTNQSSKGSSRLSGRARARGSSTPHRSPSRPRKSNSLSTKKRGRGPPKKSESLTPQKKSVRPSKPESSAPRILLSGRPRKSESPTPTKRGPEPPRKLESPATSKSSPGRPKKAKREGVRGLPPKKGVEEAKVVDEATSIASTSTRRSARLSNRRFQSSGEAAASPHKGRIHSKDKDGDGSTVPPQKPPAIRRSTRASRAAADDAQRSRAEEDGDSKVSSVRRSTRIKQRKLLNNDNEGGSDGDDVDSKGSTRKSRTVSRGIKRKKQLESSDHRDSLGSTREGRSIDVPEADGDESVSSMESASVASKRTRTSAAARESLSTIAEQASGTESRSTARSTRGRKKNKGTQGNTRTRSNRGSASTASASSRASKYNLRKRN